MIDLICSTIVDGVGPKNATSPFPIQKEAYWADVIPDGVPGVGLEPTLL